MRKSDRKAAVKKWCLTVVCVNRLDILLSTKLLCVSFYFFLWICADKYKFWCTSTSFAVIITKIHVHHISVLAGLTRFSHYFRLLLHDTTNWSSAVSLKLCLYYKTICFYLLLFEQLNSDNQPNTNRTPVGVLLLYGFLLWLLPTHKWFQKDSTKETRFNRLALDLFQLSQKIATLEGWISILHQRWENELLLDSLEKPTLCQPTNTSVTPCNCSSVKTKTQINSSISGISAQLIHSSGNFQSVHYHSCYPVMKWWTTSLIQLLKLLRLLLL